MGTMYVTLTPHFFPARVSPGLWSKVRGYQHERLSSALVPDLGGKRNGHIGLAYIAGGCILLSLTSLVVQTSRNHLLLFSVAIVEHGGDL